MQTFLFEPEVFWVGVQSLVAVLALIGLIFYTLYTRRMMITSEKIQRASTLPALVIQTDTVDRGIREVNILNAGGGPALNVILWAQKVSDSFELNGNLMKHRPSVGEVFLGTLPSQKSMRTADTYYSRNDKLLYVVEATDLAGGTQQMQLVTFANSDERQVMPVNKLDSNLSPSKALILLRNILKRFHSATEG
jgi:hypothetical protein